MVALVSGANNACDDYVWILNNAYVAVSKKQEIKIPQMGDFLLYE